MFDEDIKIAELGDRQSNNGNEKTRSVSEEYDRENAKGNTVKARLFGVELAKEVIDNLNTFAMENEESGNSEMAVQRGILMIFTATSCIENNVASTIVSQTAKNSFNSELEQKIPSLYKAVNASGAFSFYYLAYRRGTEIERRIGQTFAMLCSHDGDPVYQELGEAIYCWFKSISLKCLEKSGIH